MRSMLLSSILATLVPALATAQAVAPPAPPAAPTEAVPPAAFADPARRDTLARAFPGIDAFLRESIPRAGRPGGVLGVVIDGELAHVTAVGVQDLDSRRPVTPDTVFRIASMTKSFTAMAILKLRDAGKLSLEDAVERHVPELRGLSYPTSDSPRLTIRHLLSHSEGFPEDNPWGDRQLGRSDAWLDSQLRAGIPFSTAPGTAYEYSNYGFAILGRVIQNVSGVEYTQFVTREILQPLGMTATTFQVEDVPPPVRAQGYRRDGAGHAAEPPLAHGAFGAMGGLWTSTRDLAKYVAFLAGAFPPRNGAETGPVSRATAREMQQLARHDASRAFRAELDAPLQLSSGGYAFGLRVSEDCDLGVLVGHGGGLPGYGSLMQWSPDRGVALVAMGNLTYAGWAGEFREVWRLLRQTGGLAARVVQPAPTLVAAQREVTRLIFGWDDDLARRIAADNLFLDQPAASRRDAIAAALAGHGACQPGSGIDAENALRGRWQMPCERGWLEVAITLAPTPVPLVQMLSVASVLPPGPRLAERIAAAAALVGAWDDGRARELFAPGASIDAFARQARLAALEVGACRPGQTLRGDGAHALVVFECDRGTLMVDAALDAAGDRLQRLSLRPDSRRACVP